MSTPQEETDYGDPAFVVRCFIQAMNEWEKESWKSQRECRSTTDPSSYQVEVRTKMDSLFSRFCTTKDRKFGRQGSFQKPPEYDPDKEPILGTEVGETRKRAYVITHRQAILGGGRRRYTLIRTNGRWLIDNVKREWEGDWQNAIL